MTEEEMKQLLVRNDYLESNNKLLFEKIKVQEKEIKKLRQELYWKKRNDEKEEQLIITDFIEELRQGISY